jgi:hypothetical protein
MLFVSNAFSFNMFTFVPEVLVQTEMTQAEASDFLKKREFTSVFGHADSASLVSQLLGVEIEFNRSNQKFTYQDQIFVIQYSGPRLPEGATSLPEGAGFKYILVEPRTKNSVGCYHCGPDTVLW